jgi:hypothetical protein
MTYPHPNSTNDLNLGELPDAIDEAMTHQPSRFFGCLTVDAYKCVLIKGQGKVPFDPTQHANLRTSVAINFTVAPLDPTRKLITREVLNWVREFRLVIRPSIEMLAETIAQIKGLPADEFNPLREVSGMWVGGEFVPRPDNKPDEDWTTLKFTAVYPDRAACELASIAVFGSAPATPSPTPSPIATDPERTALAAFLPMMWEQSNHDLVKMAQMIADNPMLADKFDIDSPEVTALTGVDDSKKPIPF